LIFLKILPLLYCKLVVFCLIKYVNRLLLLEFWFLWFLFGYRVLGIGGWVFLLGFLLFLAWELLFCDTLQLA
jgi:hypothetical protein